MVLAALIYGAASGTLDKVSAAVSEGAADAVNVTLSLTGTLCLWSGVTEAIRRAGGMNILQRAARPFLRHLFSASADDPEITEAVAANMAANILGLGNAATPPGIRAAVLMASSERTSDDLAALAVLNTSSIQLIPATAAALRASLGAKSPFDILPAVWCASAAALLSGLAMLCLLRYIGNMVRAR